MNSTIEGARIEGNAVSLSAPGADIGVRGDVIGTEAQANRLVGSGIGLGRVTATVDAETVLVQVEVLAPPPPEEASPSPTPSEPPKVEEPGKPVVAQSVQLAVGTVSCGSSACHVETSSASAKIGGKKVKPPASIAAGGSARVKVVLPKSVRRALAKGKPKKRKK